MPAAYFIRQDPDRSWTVVVATTGAPVRLAGIPQSGLSLIEAEITLEILSPARFEAGEPSRSLAFPECATAA